MATRSKAAADAADIDTSDVPFINLTDARRGVGGVWRTAGVATAGIVVVAVTVGPTAIELAKFNFPRRDNPRCDNPRCDVRMEHGEWDDVLGNDVVDVVAV